MRWKRVLSHQGLIFRQGGVLFLGLAMQPLTEQAAIIGANLARFNRAAGMLEIIGQFYFPARVGLNGIVEIHIASPVHLPMP